MRTANLAKALRLAPHALAVALLFQPAPSARATADGPDFFRVVGVAAGDVLNMRTGPGTEHAKIGEIPPDEDGLGNLGCVGGLDFAAWQQATPEQREKARKTRWCRVSYRGTEGWVAAWFLTEGGPPAEPAQAPPQTLAPGQPVPTPKPATAATAVTPSAEAASNTVRWRLIGTPAGAAVGEGWIRFAADGSVSGNTGCNNFHGSAVLGPGTISFPGPFAATKMFCMDDATMAQEDRLFAELAGATQYRVDLVTGLLTISGSADGPGWTFVAEAD